MPDVTIPIQAARFLHDHGNVGRNADDLLRDALTIAQLKEAVNYAKRQADVAMQVMMTYHGIKEEQNAD